MQPHNTEKTSRFLVHSHRTINNNSPLRKQGTIYHHVSLTGNIQTLQRAVAVKLRRERRRALVIKEVV
jgi:hypothetical protein